MGQNMSLKIEYFKIFPILFKNMFFVVKLSFNKSK